VELRVGSHGECEPWSCGWGPMGCASHGAAGGVPWGVRAMELRVGSHGECEPWSCGWGPTGSASHGAAGGVPRGVRAVEPYGAKQREKPTRAQSTESTPRPAKHWSSTETAFCRERAVTAHHKERSDTAHKERGVTAHHKSGDMRERVADPREGPRVTRALIGARVAARFGCGGRGGRTFARSRPASKSPSAGTITSTAIVATSIHVVSDASIDDGAAGGSGAAAASRSSRTMPPTTSATGRSDADDPAFSGVGSAGGLGRLSTRPSLGDGGTVCTILGVE
jgi:hypothetical protein